MLQKLNKTIYIALFGFLGCFFYRNVRVDVFVGLSAEDAKMVGNRHNKKTVTKRLFFQVEVFYSTLIVLDRIKIQKALITNISYHFIILILLMVFTLVPFPH